jgi:hypothetical protein
MNYSLKSIVLCGLSLLLFGCSGVPQHPYVQGTNIWANGDKYVGEWMYGRRHGQGTHTYADGSEAKGIWEAGVYLAATEAEAEAKRKRRRIAEEAERERRRIARKKYERIFNACILDKSAGRDMPNHLVLRALNQTCREIAEEPSCLDSLKYD